MVATLVTRKSQPGAWSREPTPRLRPGPIFVRAHPRVPFQKIHPLSLSFQAARISRFTQSSSKVCTVPMTGEMCAGEPISGGPSSDKLSFLQNSLRSTVDPRRFSWVSHHPAANPKWRLFQPESSHEDLGPFSIASSIYPASRLTTKLQSISLASKSLSWSILSRRYLRRSPNAAS